MAYYLKERSAADNSKNILLAAVAAIGDVPVGDESLLEQTYVMATKEARNCLALHEALEKEENRVGSRTYKDVCRQMFYLQVVLISCTLGCA